jgi:hypothetical protein
MTRALAGTVVALAAVGVAGADNPRDRDEGKAVAAKLEGKWVANVFTLDGRERREYNVTFTFKGEGVTFSLGGKGRDGKWAVANGTFEIDVMGWKGIARFDGFDTLTVCLDLLGNGRPTEFETGKQLLGRLLVTLERPKK